VALDATQKEKLAALLAQEHVAVLVTQGERWPTANLQAFAETPEFELLFIMGGNSDKYQNLLKHPEATVLVDNRDVGKVPTFEITRAWVQGIASVVARATAEWESLKALFLKKNPFEEPFFKNDGLRMIRIRPVRVSYASGLRDTFKAEL
jgi:nitroimidazol reductase NimA-like FMN-containing flavoprotein (pyridoxamine 5'-phosphate oxidase superfamily)